MTQCLTCDLVTRRDQNNAPIWDCIYRTQYWDVVHCNSTSLLGWLILVVRRHIAAVDEMTEDESIELGKLIQHVSLALKEEIGCTKTYIAQFAESPGHQHVHFHIMPCMPDQPESEKGPSIFKHCGVLPEDRVDESKMNELALKIRTRLPLLYKA